MGPGLRHAIEAGPLMLPGPCMYRVQATASKGQDTHTPSGTVSECFLDLQGGVDGFLSTIKKGSGASPPVAIPAQPRLRPSGESLVCRI